MVKSAKIEKAAKEKEGKVSEPEKTPLSVLGGDIQKELEEMFLAGVHFGYSKKSRHAKMKSCLFGSRNHTVRLVSGCDSLCFFLVLFFMDSIFASIGANIDFSIIDSFNFTPLSIIQAFTFGMLITLVTVSFTSKRIAKLNIVRAIRNIPEPKISRKSRNMLRIGTALIVIGALSTVLAYTFFDRWAVAALYLGISLIMIGAGFLLRRFIGDRLSFSISICLFEGFPHKFNVLFYCHIKV